MQYTLSEKKVLKKLGIENFGHMTKDKIMQFASMIPQMDPEVAKKALEQFPEFKNMAIEVVKNIKETVTKSIESNDESQHDFYNTCNRVIELLENQLCRDELTETQEADIRANLITITRMMYDKDTEHKEFLLKVIKTVCASAAVILIASTSLLGVDIKGIGKHTD